MLHRLGGGSARARARHRGDRRQDLAAGTGEGQRSAAPGLGLGEPAAAGAGPGGRGGEVNEINAIPRLLARLELQGALVTIDAIDFQAEIAKAIRAKGADYLLALKDNWPALAEEVRRAFDTAPAGTLATHVITDGDHGRIEVRHAFVSHDVGWLA